MSPEHRDTVLALELEIPRLRRFARFMTRDPDRADDLVQECLTRAITNIGSWRPGTNLRAWLFVILKNVFRNEKRRSNYEASHLRHLEYNAAPYSAADQITHVTLSETQKAFHQLSDDHREVLALVGVEGLKYGEVALMLGVSVGTVKSRLSRARTALRTLAVDCAPISEFALNRPSALFSHSTTSNTIH